MGKTDYDFSGWATRNDIRCADGLTIRQNAFKDCDGLTVPIVWSHIHDDPEMVLGHALLENRPEGVRIYGKFNDSPKGQQTKALVESGDVVGLSIWANQLKKRAGDVLHGVIREVSVVLAGANPGAYIDTVMLAHSDEEIDYDNFEAVITTGEFIELAHAAKDDEVEDDDEEEETNDVEEILNTLTDKQKKAMYAVIGQILENKDKEMNDKKDEVAHSATEGESKMASYDDMNAAEIFDTLDEGQQEAVYAILGQAMADVGISGDEADDDDEDGEDYDDDGYEDGGDYGEGEDGGMKHNVFYGEDEFLSHSEMQAAMQDVFADAKRLGSLREAVNNNIEEGGILAHTVYNHNADGTQGAAQTYGIADINYLFPEARTLSNIPPFIKRNDEWVNVIINGTHHTPFSRIKSVFANITNEEARARGYVKGNQKANEVFSLLKRSTDPQTIYKKQKMDRDDIIDITDFDVVAWLRGEMRMMLNEEIARAVLIGDGRLNSDDDKIKEDHIRPIATDASLYTIQAPVTKGETDEITAKNCIKAAIRARKDYKGSGSPTLFTTETWLTEMMLLEDGLGHPLYADEAALARRLRVSRIVSVPVMENYTISGKEVYGVIVNLSDYNIGADKGGEINMFDDFDIDYNQQKYLIETRISGALTRPYSAIVLVEATTATSST